MTTTYRVYEIAKQPAPDGCEFIGIDLDTEPRSHPLCVWRGVGAVPCSVQELLSSWREHLELCAAGWLVPVLERFASGEEFSDDAVLQAYQRHHGQPAPFRDIARNVDPSVEPI